LLKVALRYQVVCWEHGFQDDRELKKPSEVFPNLLAEIKRFVPSPKLHTL
jgi:hypothetical protein